MRDWVTAIGLEPSGYGTHSLRRTKAAEIYRKIGNLRTAQLLLGHTKVDTTVRYLVLNWKMARASQSASTSSETWRVVPPFAISKRMSVPHAALVGAEPKVLHAAFHIGVRYAYST